MLRRSCQSKAFLNPSQTLLNLTIASSFFQSGFIKLLQVVVVSVLGKGDQNCGLVFELLRSVQFWLEFYYLFIWKICIKWEECYLNTQKRVSYQHLIIFYHSIYLILYFRFFILTFLKILMGCLGGGLYNVQKSFFI